MPKLNGWLRLNKDMESNFLNLAHWALCYLYYLQSKQSDLKSNEFIMGGAYLFVYSKSLIDLSFEMQEA